MAAKTKPSLVGPMNFDGPCKHCHGTGRRPIGKALITTLSILNERGESNGSEMASCMGVSPPTMSNRLARLQELGFIDSRWDGNHRIWRVMPINGRNT